MARNWIKSDNQNTAFPEHFFVLHAVGGISSSLYANCERDPHFPIRYEDPVRCSRCGRPKTLRKWADPHYIVLTGSTRVGDLIVGQSGQLFFSERLLSICREARIRGITREYPCAIISNGLDSIHRFKMVDLSLDSAIVDDLASNAVRQNVDCDECRSGILESYDRVTIIESTWNGDDLFDVSSYGITVVSRRFVDLCMTHRVANISFIPCSKAHQSFKTGDHSDYQAAIIPTENG